MRRTVNRASRVENRTTFLVCGTAVGADGAHVRSRRRESVVTGFLSSRVPTGPRVPYQQARGSMGTRLNDSESSTQRSSAFTLLEVILAIGLTTLLMGALYTAMNIYWTMAMESYDEIQRAQIARALLRDLARDIQSCTFIEQQETESDSEEDDEDDGAADADTALSTYTNGLFGTDKDLVLYMSRPAPDPSSYVSSQDLLLPSDRSSDAIITRYVLAEDGGAGLAGQFAADPSAAEITDPVKGLARMEGDMAGLSNAIATGDVDMQLNATRMLATEVAALSFEYYDGVDYMTEWDSTASNAMPLAIVVELTLRSLPNPNDARPVEQQQGYLNPTVHRLVVPIPVAKPFVGEGAL